MSFRNEIFLYLIVIKTTFAFYQTTSNVTVLTAENFEANVLGAESIWVVQFYSSNSRECENFEKEFLQSASILKSIVKFGAVNVENDAELTKHYNADTQVLPLVKFFGIRSDDRTIDYNGSKTAKDLVDSVLTNILEKIKNQFGDILPENLIEEVNDKNFDHVIIESKEPWLVQFYAPWCVHCKQFKPIWTQAAANLNGKVKFASIDATVNKIKAKEFGIKAYPTVKLLPTRQKSPKNALEYTNERSVTEIINWVLEALPGPDVVQITSAEVFQRGCMTKKLCIISILPHILDCHAVCRRNYLVILRKLGETYKKHEWGWTWSEGGAQKDMEKLLDVGGFGYPTLVMLNPSKKKYAVFKGAFTKNDINDFLIQLAKANAVNIDDDIVTKIVVVELWNGKDSDLSEDFRNKDEL